jgi:hypothetical protein
LALSLVGILAAIFINPRGWESWQYVISMLSSSSNMQFSAEWGPPVNQGWQMNLFFGWLLLFPVLAAFAPRKLSRLEWAWFVGFGAPALWGTRYVIWFIMLLAVFTAQLLSSWEERWSRASKPGSVVFNWVLSLLFVILPLVFLPGVRQSWWPQAPDDTQNTPVFAVEWLEDHSELKGPLLTEIGLPATPNLSCLNGRCGSTRGCSSIRWSSAAICRFYLRLRWLGKGTGQNGGNLIMVSLSKQPRLAAVMEKSLNWGELYRDEIAVIYSRGACYTN